MTITEQKLLEIARTKRISESDMDYFEDHIEKYPSKWGNLYLWSVQVSNYRVSNYILECGLDLNQSEEVQRDMIGSYSRFGLYTEKIIQDGFELTLNTYNDIVNMFSNDKYFDSEKLKKDFKNSLNLSRYRKISKIRGK